MLAANSDAWSPCSASAPKREARHAARPPLLAPPAVRAQRPADGLASSAPTHTSNDPDRLTRDLGSDEPMHDPGDDSTGARRKSSVSANLPGPDADSDERHRNLTKTIKSEMRSQVIGPSHTESNPATLHEVRPLPPVTKYGRVNLDPGTTGHHASHRMLRKTRRCYARAHCI
jgi:hypothetical protein